MNETMRVKLDADAVDLLAWNVANEVVNGFRIDPFAATIGTSVEEFRELVNRLRSVPHGESVEVTVIDATALRNALDATLRELGEEEFQTRTGHGFTAGNSMLAHLNCLLGSR